MGDPQTAASRVDAVTGFGAGSDIVPAGCREGRPRAKPLRARGPGGGRADDPDPQAPRVRRNRRRRSVRVDQRDREARYAARFWWRSRRRLL